MIRERFEDGGEGLGGGERDGGDRCESGVECEEKEIGVWQFRQNGHTSTRLFILDVDDLAQRRFANPLGATMKMA